jgi:DNA-binding transcriptional ArsR family regulator
MARSPRARPPYRGGVVSSTLVDSSLVELTGGFGALAEPVRPQIMGVLADGGRCVCDPHEQVPVAANLLSCHRRVLRDAGLVIAAGRGQWVAARRPGQHRVVRAGLCGRDGE